MNKRFLVVCFVLFLISGAASATIVQGIDLEFVSIGNIGNPGDVRTTYPNSANPYGAGSVDHAYKIGKYEITYGQWNTFITDSGAPDGSLYNFLGTWYDPYDPFIMWTGTNVAANGVCNFA